MPNIPLYERQVAPTTEIAGAMASPEAAAAPWRAVAQLGGEVAEIGFEFAERRRAARESLEAEKRRAERKLLELDIKNRIGIARNVYESDLANRRDYAKFGASEDEGFQSFSSSVGELFADERLKNHPDLMAELQIHAQGELANAQVDAQEIGARELHTQTKAVINEGVDNAISGGRTNEALSLIDESPVHTDAEKEKMRIDIPRRAQEVNIQGNIAFNPKETLDALVEQKRGGEQVWPDLSPEDLTKWEGVARTTYNRQISDNATSMWDRFNDVRDGKNDEDTFASIERDLNNLEIYGKISPSDYNQIKKVLDNPYGETKKAMPPDELNNLWTTIGKYDPEIDPDFQKASTLWARINSVPNEQDRTLLKGLMRDAQEGVPQSPYWGEIQEIIDADSKRNIFGDSEISTETGVFAKREVARYLRENPTDRDGAMKLYDGISSDDKKLNTRRFYRQRYGYGTVNTSKDVRVWGAK